MKAIEFSYLIPRAAIAYVPFESDLTEWTKYSPRGLMTTEVKIYGTK